MGFVVLGLKYFHDNIDVKHVLVLECLFIQISLDEVRGNPCLV
jgi:hypothetical protein